MLRASLEQQPCRLKCGAAILGAVLGLPLLLLPKPAARSQRSGAAQEVVHGIELALTGLEEDSEDLALNVTLVDDVLGALKSKRAEILARVNASDDLIARWRTAQMDMFVRTFPIRLWQGKTKDNGAINPNEWSCLSYNMEGGCLADEDFFIDFVWHHFFADPKFFVGLVYIPIPWMFVLENAARVLKTMEPAHMVASLMSDLPKGWKYFTVMQQSHVGQLGKVLGWERLPWDPEAVLVFDSRGLDSGKAPYQRVAVPLLKTRAVQLDPVEKTSTVFFSGHCRDVVRDAIGTKVPHGNTSMYEWKVRKCNHLLPQEVYDKELREATWAITPAGTMPTSFTLFETLQAGGLPIIPYSRFVDDKHPFYDNLTAFKTETSQPFLWLPYRDIGVRWHSELAEILPWQLLSNLTEIIEAIPAEAVRRRQALVKKYHPLFTSDGLTAYILYVVALAYHAGAGAASALGEQFALARAVAG